jgi:hypothetical protein
MSKRVGQAPTAGEQTQQNPCRTSSDIGAELENNTVGRGPMQDRKGLKLHFATNAIWKQYIEIAPYSKPQAAAIIIFNIVIVGCVRCVSCIVLFHIFVGGILAGHS